MPHANISPLEIIWTLATLAGVLVNLESLYQAAIDWRVIRSVPCASWTSARRIVGWQHIRNAGARLVCMAAFLTLGIVAMATPPAPSMRQVTPTQLVFTVALLINVALQVLIPVLERVDRRAVLRLIADDHRDSGQRRRRDDGAT